MFLNSPDEVLEIAKKNGSIIFVLPNNLPLEIKNAFLIQPEEKIKISIEQIRSINSKLNLKQFNDVFVVIRPADFLNDEAANALLKNIEEPGEKIHYILVTDSPFKLLPTILSRAPIYYLRQNVDFKLLDTQDDEIKKTAKEMILAKGPDLVKLSEKIAMHQPKTREYALLVLGTAIEILYKSYFLTNRETFINKIPKFLAAYDGIARNGHIKLHLVANLC